MLYDPESVIGDPCMICIEQTILPFRKLFPSATLIKCRPKGCQTGYWCLTVGWIGSAIMIHNDDRGKRISKLLADTLNDRGHLKGICDQQQAVIDRYMLANREAKPARVSTLGANDVGYRVGPKV
jgi:hypothetical protein